MLDAFLKHSKQSIRTLKIPAHIHDMYTKGGADRTQLMDMLREANLDKETQPIYHHMSNPIHPPIVYIIDSRPQ